jgi:hypothetical protein
LNHGDATPLAADGIVPASFLPRGAHRLSCPGAALDQFSLQTGTPYTRCRHRCRRRCRRRRRCCRRCPRRSFLPQRLLRLVPKRFTFGPALPTRVVVIVFIVIVIVVVIVILVVVIVVVVVVVVAVVVVAVIVIIVVNAPFLSPRLLRSMPTHYEPAGRQATFHLRRTYPSGFAHHAQGGLFGPHRVCLRPQPLTRWGVRGVTCRICSLLHPPRP